MYICRICLKMIIMRVARKVILFSILMHGVLLGFSQDYYNMACGWGNMITTCDAWIYDDGGPDSNYSNDCFCSLQIFPANPGGRVVITSMVWEMGGFDSVRIINGFGSWSWGTILYVLTRAGSYSTPIASTDYSGAITILYKTNSSGTGPGFAIHVECESPTAMSSNTLTGCSFLWSDPGGAWNYTTNQDITQTFYSPNGERLQVEFNAFSLGSGDSLYVYDGNSTSSHLIGVYSNSSPPYTAISSGDCLTFRFVSDSVDVSTGWMADIECRTCYPASTSPGSPCAFNNIHPFCTNQGTYTYYSGTTGDASVFFGSTSVACLNQVPAPAWYYMRIDQPGDISIKLQQHALATGMEPDIDFACWGPFTPNSTQEFIEDLCCGYYPLNTEYHVSNTGYNSGFYTPTNHDYPYGNLVDCSYDPEGTEHCHIHNAQTGEYYLLMITNYSHMLAQVTFFAEPTSTATTDCHILNEIHNDGPYCEGDTIHLFSDNIQPDATYSWSGPNGWTSSQMHPIFWPATSSIDSAVFHMVMILNGIVSDTATTTIYVTHVDPANIVASDTEICLGDTVTLTAACPSDTLPCAPLWLPGNSTSEILTVTPSVTSSYILQETIDGCIVRDTVTVLVYYPAVNPDTVFLNIRNQDLPYEYENQTFTSTGTYTLHLLTQYGCDSTVTLVLRYIDTVYVYLDSVVCAENFPLIWNGVTFWSDSTTQVTLLAADSENSADSIIQMAVTTSPSPILSIIPEHEICSGNTLYLVAGEDASSDIVLVSNALASGVSCSLTGPWITSDGNNSFIISTPTLFQDSSLNYQLRIRDHLGCIFDSIINISILHTITGDTMATACGVFNWYEHRNIKNSCDNLTHTFYPANSCDSIVTLHLTIYPLPEPCFNHYPIHNGYLKGEPLHFIVCSTNLVNYHWNMGNGDVFDDLEFDYTYNSAGTYTVTLDVVDQNGCMSSRRQIVVIKPLDKPIYIPNSFTPNGDGLNDVFKPTGSGITSVEYLLTIYDKWGVVVFQTTDPEEGWDGTYQGTLVPCNSVMSYTLRFIREDGMVRRKGAIVVLY